MPRVKGTAKDVPGQEEEVSPSGEQEEEVEQVQDQANQIEEG